VSLSDDVIEVWTAGLRVDAVQLEDWRKLLSRDERERASRFRFERHRERFTAARAILRILVGMYSGVAAESVRFDYGLYGKPMVPGDLAFNASDSSELALFAFTRGREVGVDVEMLRPKENALQLAGRFFAPAEVEQIREAPAAERERWFFACWTRKEAYAKALGRGLNVPLKEFVVDCNPRLKHPGLFGADGWSLQTLDVAEDYVAALCCEGVTAPAISVRRFR
jgi:4'-phosphopantetheinyl transferase